MDSLSESSSDSEYTSSGDSDIELDATVLSKDVLALPPSIHDVFGEDTDSEASSLSEDDLEDIDNLIASPVNTTPKNNNSSQKNKPQPKKAVSKKKKGNVLQDEEFDYISDEGEDNEATLKDVVYDDNYDFTSDDETPLNDNRASRRKSQARPKKDNVKESSKSKNHESKPKSQEQRGRSSSRREPSRKESSKKETSKKESSRKRSSKETKNEDKSKTTKEVKEKEDDVYPGSDPEDSSLEDSIIYLTLPPHKQKPFEPTISPLKIQQVNADNIDDILGPIGSSGNTPEQAGSPKLIPGSQNNSQNSSQNSSQNNSQNNSPSKGPEIPLDREFSLPSPKGSQSNSSSPNNSPNSKTGKRGTDSRRSSTSSVSQSRDTKRPRGSDGKRGDSRKDDSKRDDSRRNGDSRRSSTSSHGSRNVDSRRSSVSSTRSNTRESSDSRRGTKEDKREGSDSRRSSTSSRVSSDSRRSTRNENDSRRSSVSSRGGDSRRSSVQSDTDRKWKQRERSRRSDRKKGDEKRRALLNEEEKEKRELIYELYMMEKSGMPVSKRFTVEDNLDEMRFEYHKLKSESDIKDKVKMGWNMFLCFNSVIELINTKVDPFNVSIEGWGDDLDKEKEKYEPHFRKLYKQMSCKFQVQPGTQIALLFASQFLVFIVPRLLKKIQKKKEPEAITEVSTPYPKQPWETDDSYTAPVAAKSKTVNHPARAAANAQSASGVPSGPSSQEYLNLMKDMEEMKAQVNSYSQKIQKQDNLIRQQQVLIEQYRTHSTVGGSPPSLSERVLDKSDVFPPKNIQGNINGSVNGNIHGDIQTPAANNAVDETPQEPESVVSTPAKGSELQSNINNGYKPMLNESEYSDSDSDDSDDSENEDEPEDANSTSLPPPNDSVAGAMKQFLPMMRIFKNNAQGAMPNILPEEMTLFKEAPEKPEYDATGIQTDIKPNQSSVDTTVDYQPVQENPQKRQSRSRSRRGTNTLKLV